MNSSAFDMHPFRLRLFRLMGLLVLALTSCRTLTPGPPPAAESGWSQVSGSCGIAPDENAYCWGWDAEARIFPPAPLADGHRFRFATGTLYQGCGLARDGVAHCWGLELMRAKPVPAAAECGGPWQRPCPLTPGPLSADLRFRDLSVGGEYGEYACGITVSGEAYCWGRADGGRVGSAPADTVCLPHGCYAAPSRIESRAPLVSVSAGGGHACALDAEGRAYCWGTGAHAQLGREAPERCPELSYTLPCSRTALLVQGDLRFATITAGAVHTCGLTPAGLAYCWGSDHQGQLGTDAQQVDCSSGHVGLPCSPTPLPVAGSHRYRRISAHGSHTCALTPAGEAYCWGEGRYGLGGRGPIEREWPYGERSTRVRVLGDLSFADVSAWLTCGRTARGELYCSGITSPAHDIAAPVRMPDPPERPLLRAFKPKPAPESNSPTFRIWAERGIVRVEGTGPAHCANHAFHAAATRQGRELELWVVAGRWEGGGCIPTEESFAYEAALGELESGRYRLRILHHFTDDRGQVRREWMSETEVEVP